MNFYKLAFVIERYFEFGGLQRNMLRFALACTKAGHDVTVFTGHWDGPTEPTVKIEIVNFTSLTNHGKIKEIEDLVRLLRQQNRFDCVTGFNRVGGLDVYYGGDVCLKAKLLERHRYWMRFLPRYSTYLKQEEAVFGPAGDTELMLISPAEAQKIVRLYKTPPGRIHMLPPGIDRDRLAANPLPGEQRSQFRGEFNAQADDFLILTVGSSFRTKGIDRAIQAIAGLPQELKRRCRYVVVGQGDEKKFGAMARKAGIGDHVFFTGGRKDIASFYYAADVLLHPARTENTGNALLEAMMTGLAVIATENCGYAYYIQQANAGAVCPEPFNQKQFNQLVYDVLINDPQRLAFGRNGRQYCQVTDIYSRVDEGMKVILKCAEKNRGQR